MEETGNEVNRLPGFRFHPTEEELLNFYLRRMVFGKKLYGDIIGLLNIYNHDPRELPGLAKRGEREWYFFVPRERKHGNGGRPNRTTEKGFWKATGSDRKILSMKDPKKVLGLKKTLVFYEGRAARPRKTDWVMNEYRLPDYDHHHTNANSSPPPKDIVLCKIYRKATSLKALEQKANMEKEQVKMVFGEESSLDSISICCNQLEEIKETNEVISDEQTETVAKKEDDENGNGRGRIRLPDNGRENLMELQVPKPNNLMMDWTQDSFWAQLRSPWLENFASYWAMC